MALKANIVIDQGSDFTYTFELSDDNDQLIDLTGYTGNAAFRKHYTSLQVYTFGVDIDEVNSEVTLSMNAATSANIAYGRYVYDCELTDSSNVVSRIVEGIVTITPRVRK